MEDTNCRAGESVDFDTISEGAAVINIYRPRSQTGHYRLVEDKPTNGSSSDESPAVDYLHYIFFGIVSLRRAATRSDLLHWLTEWKG